MERIVLAPRRQHRARRARAGPRHRRGRSRTAAPTAAPATSRGCVAQQRAPGVGRRRASRRARPGAARRGGRARARCAPAASGSAASSSARASATSEGSVRLSRKPAFITRGSGQRRVGGDRRVEVVERRAVERQHPPERDLARLERGLRAGAGRRCRARRTRPLTSAAAGGSGQGRGAGRIASQARATWSTPRSSWRCRRSAGRSAGRRGVQPQLMLAAGCSLMLNGDVKRDVLERPRRIVGRRGELGGEGGIGAVGESTKSNGRRAATAASRIAAHLAEAAEHALAPSASAPRLDPADDVGQHLAPAARPAAPRCRARSACARSRPCRRAWRGVSERRDRLDVARRRRSKRSAAAATAAATSGSTGRPAPAIEQQADAQAAHVALEPLPGDRLAAAGSSCRARRAAPARPSAARRRRRVRVIGPATRPA